MHIKIEKTKLHNHLNSCSIAISNNTYLNALQGVKIDVSESNIKLLTSNGSLSIKEVISEDSNLEIIEPGTILVPGKTLISIIKNLKGIIEIKKVDNLLLITNDNFKSEINLMDMEDFSEESFETIGSDKLEIDVDEFKELINDVAYATSEDDSSSIINGINLNAYDGILTAYATNKHRIAFKSIEVDRSIDFNITILKSNLKNFIPTNTKGLIQIFIDDDKIITKNNTTTTKVNLITGSFPDIKSLIPTNYSKTIKLNSEHFLKALNKSTSLSNDTDYGVEISIANNEMLIESRKKEIGATHVVYKDFEYLGEDVKFRLNYLYLKQAISNLKGDVIIKFNDPSTIFLIESENNNKYKQLILPLRSHQGA